MKPFKGPGIEVLESNLQRKLIIYKLKILETEKDKTRKKYRRVRIYTHIRLERLLCFVSKIFTKKMTDNKGKNHSNKKDNQTSLNKVQPRKGFYRPQGTT